MHSCTHEHVHAYVCTHAFVSIYAFVFMSLCVSAYVYVVNMLDINPYESITVTIRLHSIPELSDFYYCGVGCVYVIIRFVFYH